MMEESVKRDKDDAVETLLVMEHHNEEAKSHLDSITNLLNSIKLIYGEAPRYFSDEDIAELRSEQEDPQNQEAISGTESNGESDSAGSVSSAAASSIEHTTRKGSGELTRRGK